MELENSNPSVIQKKGAREFTDNDYDETYTDEIDSREIFDIIREIKDPEHPLTLEQLQVVSENNITVNNNKNEVIVRFTPTVPHCSMASLIGLSIRVLLLRTLPPHYKVSVEIEPKTHSSEHAVNKQLADKERIAAALDNQSLAQVIQQCIQIDRNDEIDYDGNGTQRLLQRKTLDAPIITDDLLKTDIDDYTSSMVYLTQVNSIAVDLNYKNNATVA